MNEKRIKLFSERLAEIQAEATDRVVLLADDLGMDRDKAFFLMFLGLGDMYKNFTLKDYIPRNKE